MRRGDSRPPDNEPRRLGPRFVTVPHAASYLATW